MSHNPLQMVAAFIDLLNADSALMTLCGSADGAADPRVHVGFPDVAEPALPLITVAASFTTPDGTATDLFRGSWEIEVFGEGIQNLGSILSYLRENYSIPLRRAEEITSTNFVMEVLRCSNQFNPVPFRRSKEDRTIKMLPSLWLGKVKPKPSS